MTAKTERVRRRLALLEFYKELDTSLAELHRNYKVSCVRGCHACCRMPVLMTVAEAEYIVDRYPNAVRRALPELRAQCAELGGIVEPLVAAGREPFEDATAKEIADAWWKLSKSCALLVGGECSVYEARPYPCRSYHVQSDPALCASDDVTTQVQIIEPIARNRGFRVLADRQPGGEVDVGYLPSTVLLAASKRL